MTKRLTALMLALAIALMPFTGVFAQAEVDDIELPDLYNVYDYLKLVAFLEQTDGDGVKNGEKISSLYNPLLPSTFGLVEWTDTNPKRLYSVNFTNYYVNLSGELVGELDLAGCSSLVSVYCSRNALTSIDLHGCPELTYLACGGNGLENLNLSSCPALRTLWCRNNLLTELDLSGFPELSFIDCINNLLSDIDLSANPLLPLDGVYADGEGYVGFASYLSGSEPVLPGVGESYGLFGSAVYASPAEGWSFDGWYSETGDMVGSYRTLVFTNQTLTEVTAVFTDGVQIPVFGDVDLDDEITTIDALLVLRYSLGEAELEPEQLLNADVNSDGVVDSLDALLILRFALGMISEF